MVVGWNFVIGWGRHHVVPAAAVCSKVPRGWFYLHNLIAIPRKLFLVLCHTVVFGVDRQNVDSQDECWCLVVVTMNETSAMDEWRHSGERRITRVPWVRLHPAVGHGPAPAGSNGINVDELSQKNCYFYCSRVIHEMYANGRTWSTRFGTQHATPLKKCSLLFVNASAQRLKINFELPSHTLVEGRIEKRM